MAYTLPSPELDDIWRERYEQARHRYQDAKAACQKAQLERAQGFTPPPDGSFAYRKALEMETAAFREQRRILMIFKDLILYGKIPDDDERSAIP